MLCNNRILASFLVWDKDGQTDLDPELALHVTLRHDQKLFEHVVKVAGTVKTPEELAQLATNCPEPNTALLPGILFRALIYTVEATGTVGLLYVGTCFSMPLVLHAVRLPSSVLLLTAVKPVSPSWMRVAYGCSKRTWTVSCLPNHSSHTSTTSFGPTHTIHSAALPKHEVPSIGMRNT